MHRLLLLAALAASALSGQTSGELISQDLFVSGAAAQSAAGNNILLPTAGTGSTDAMVTGVSHYRSLSVQIVGSAGIASGAVIFEWSNNNSTFFPLQMYESSTTTALGNSTVINVATAIAASANRTFHGKIMGRYVRCRISTVFAGGTIQAITRLSIADFVPWNTSLAAAQTLATVTTVSTVSAVTAASLSAASATDIASAAITTTATSGAIGVTNVQGAAFAISITAVTGTNPTLDLVIQCSVNTTTWHDVHHFERATGTTTLISPTIPLPCAQIRYVRTVGGTTPSFTMSLTRWSTQTNTGVQRSFFDRTIAPNTLNSATPAFWVEGSQYISAIVSSGAATTAASFQMEVSADGTNWASIGTAVASVASTNTLVFNAPAVAKFARVRVSAAGTGQTLNYVSVTVG